MENVKCVEAIPSKDTSQEVRDDENSFDLRGKDQVEAYIEARGGTGWLTYLDCSDVSFFSYRDKDRIQDASQIIRIPLLDFKRLLGKSPGNLYSVIEATTDNERLARAVAHWDATVYMDYVRTCVEENREFSFSMLSSVLDYISSKHLAETGNALLLMGESGTIGRYRSNRLEHNFFSGNSIKISVLNYVWLKDCVRSRVMCINVPEWEGDKSLEHIGLVISPSVEDLTERTSWGKKALELSKEPSLVENTSGYLEVLSWNYWHKRPALGRTIIDQAGMLQIDPELTNYVIAPYGHDNVLANANEEDTQGVFIGKWDDIDYALLSPYVFGFSLKYKHWGRMHVKQLDCVDFRDDAFSHLVMDEEDKRLIHSLISNFDVSSSSDFVDGKGGGCVFLFHGAPGLGKTLTAEAVAEEVRRPLYTVSVGELGVDVGTLEANLKNILDMAFRWNAVLLLDEADIFLEKRSSGDIKRNAMVGTFLRLLEYYNGILILTSNRVREVDPAFYSRISFVRRYESQDIATRKKIFQGLLDLMGQSMNEEDIEDITKVRSNGRQLKNSLRLSLMLATGEKRELRKDDIISFLERANKFQESLSRL